MYEQIQHSVLRIAVILTLVAGFGVLAYGQDAESPSVLGPGQKEDERPKSVKDFIAKQRAEKAMKDHEELLQRGDELLEITDQLENAFEKHGNLTQTDLDKLAVVEKLAQKIRKSMGGDDDDDDDVADHPEKNAPPADVAEAVIDLKDMAVKLVDELKKTSRFTISVVAVQSSNSVLKLVRFLRLKK